MNIVIGKLQTFSYNIDVPIFFGLSRVPRFKPLIVTSIRYTYTATTYTAQRPDL